MAELWFIYGAMALCLFSLWAIARHDWLRLTRPTQRIMARVIGHRKSMNGDGTSWAARYAFDDGSRNYEVVDQVFGPRSGPPVGTLVELAYPQGRPDLARPPRPWLWLGVYCALLAMTAIIVAKAAGLVDG